MVNTPMNVATPAKPSSNKENCSMKKLKGFDWLVVLGKGDVDAGCCEMLQRHGSPPAPPKLTLYECEVVDMQLPLGRSQPRNLHGKASVNQKTRGLCRRS